MESERSSVEESGPRVPQLQSRLDMPVRFLLIMNPGVSALCVESSTEFTGFSCVKERLVVVPGEMGPEKSSIFQDVSLPGKTIHRRLRDKTDELAKQQEKSCAQ